MGLEGGPRLDWQAMNLSPGRGNLLSSFVCPLFSLVAVNRKNQLKSGEKNERIAGEP